MKLGVVDIGSNAIRFQITKVLRNGDSVSFKKVEYMRYALRLGDDVFKYMEISKVKEEKFVKLMEAIKLLFELYEVDDYMICATSAMRESSNGRSIAARVKRKTGLQIDIIQGETEALYINNVVYTNLDEKNYLHIDVGGGSTELNFYVNKSKIASNSFKIGSVRRLNGLDSPEEWEEMRLWIKNNVTQEFGPIISIGTGGNIGKIYDLFTGKKANRTISRLGVEKTVNFVKQYSMEERINILMLNSDRADVIIPASEIYLSVMKWAKSSVMTVPDVGLKDGMIQMLYDRNIKGTPQANDTVRRRFFKFF